LWPRAWTFTGLLLGQLGQGIAHAIGVALHFTEGLGLLLDGREILVNGWGALAQKLLSRWTRIDRSRRVVVCTTYSGNLCAPLPMFVPPLALLLLVVRARVVALKTLSKAADEGK
jgi:hypothetical protein